MHNFITKENRAFNRIKIETLLKSVNREGMTRVLEYLDKVRFYDVPSSTYRHHNWPGGLAQHSLGVFTKALEIDNSLHIESLIIVSLLHDVCKAGKYHIDKSGHIHHRKIHIKGHGRRSLLLLEKCGLFLYPEEARAIKWHMGGHHPQNDEERAEIQIARSEPLWYTIHKADQYNAKQNN